MNSFDSLYNILVTDIAYQQFIPIKLQLGISFFKSPVLFRKFDVSKKNKTLT